MPFGLHAIQPAQQEPTQPEVVLDRRERALAGMPTLPIRCLRFRLGHVLRVTLTLGLELLAIHLPRLGPTL